MIERIDFTSCRRLLGKAYNGANGKKIAVEYEGRQYMLKFPPSGAQKPTDLSYTNSCISEHLGSSIFKVRLAFCTATHSHQPATAGCRTVFEGFLSKT